MSGGLDAAAARDWVLAFVASFVSEQVVLTDLDRRSGDGDFGTNLAQPLERAAEVVAAMGAETAVGEAFDALAGALMRAGGTSGPLFGAWFKAFSRAGGQAAELGVAELAAAAAAGVEAVQRLGGAQAGDATMVDAQEPAARALAEGARSGLPLGEALASAAVAAREGAASTAAMTARRGRASYVGDAALGVMDPGALAVALFFEAAPNQPRAPLGRPHDGAQAGALRSSAHERCTPQPHEPA